MTKRVKTYSEWDDKIICVIACFLKTLAKTAEECKAYMITGMAGAAHIQSVERKNAKTENIIQDLLDLKLGGHEYAALCREERDEKPGQCTILESTGWCDVIFVSDTSQDTGKHHKTKWAISNKNVNVRMPRIVTMNNPYSLFWRNAFCANHLMAFSTVGADANKTELTGSNDRCVKSYSAPIAGILSSLSSKNEYTRNPVCFLDTLRTSQDEMDALAHVYSNLNQPLITSEEFENKKEKKWIKKTKQGKEWLDRKTGEAECLMCFDPSSENTNKDMCSTVFMTGRLYCISAT